MDNRREQMTNKMKSSRLMDRANHLVAVATKKSGRRALRLHEEAGGAGDIRQLHDF